MHDKVHQTMHPLNITWFLKIYFPKESILNDINIGYYKEYTKNVTCRHATKEMMCMKCLEVQPVAAVCSTPSCDGFSMARYFCNICKFFDNDDRYVSFSILD